MYAIFTTGGKQYTAEQGAQLFIEKLDVKADDLVTFDKVLAIGGTGDAVFGSPYIAGAAVTAKVLKNGKGKKITVFTYRSKKNSKRKMGHRQPYTKVEITGISADGVKSEAPAAKAEAPAKAEKKPAAPKKTAAPKKEAAPKTAAKKETAAKAAAPKKPAAPKAAAPKKETAPKAAAKKETAAKTAAPKKETAPKKTATKKSTKESEG